MSRHAGAAALAVTIWAAGALGAFRVIDDPVYDAFMTYRSHGVKDPPEILLVEVDDPRLFSDDESLIGLLSALNGLGASQVAFTFLPPAEAYRFYDAAEAAGNVVFPRFLARDPLHEERMALAPLPAALAARNLTFGILDSPPGAGIHRSHRGYREIDGSLLASLEVRVFERVRRASPRLGGIEYLVDFRGGQGSLPNLSLERVLRGDLIREIVHGACVLVGERPFIPGAGMHAPTTTGERAMSLLEYRGHALSTLLAGSEIRPIPNWAGLIAITLIAVVSSLAYRAFGAGPASWCALAIVSSYAAASLAVFVWARWWLPVADLTISQGAIFLVTLRSQAMEIAASMRRAISDTSTQLREKYWPIHMRSQAPSWALIANMINQTLDLNRLIFLDVEASRRTLREILALHCSFDDISERRRDYSRAPYSDALSTKGPIKVKSFFKTKDPEEEQYLAPLIFEGDLLGFWAIGIDAAKSAAIPQFTSILRDYGASISEILHQTRRDGGRSEETLRRRLGIVEEDETYQQLNSALTLLQHRLGALDILINRLNSGIIVYDIFGRVLQINEVMLGWLRKENLAPFDMTALDLILALSDFDISKSRRLLRRVIVENSSVSFPVVFRSSPGSRFLLHLRPIHEESSSDDVASRRAGSKSLLCELVDTTALTSIYELKSRLTERLGLRLRNDLGCMDLSASLLNGGQLPLDEETRVARLLQRKVQETADMLAECQQYLAVDADSDELERFPIDPKSPLQAAMEEAREPAQRRGVRFELEEPSFVSSVFASSSKLKDLFGALLKILFQDAADDSAVVVKVVEARDIVTFEFRNTGFGIPNELLQGYVHGEQQLASEEFQKIKTAARWVQSWGGMLEASSGVGIGIHFKLHLVKFI